MIDIVPEPSFGTYAKGSALAGALIVPSATTAAASTNRVLSERIDLGFTRIRDPRRPVLSSREHARIAPKKKPGRSRASAGLLLTPRGGNS
jgi:hypothetical protein